jgi:hypothetical protein
MAIMPRHMRDMALTAYAMESIFTVKWTIVFCAEFDAEFRDLEPAVQDELLAQLLVIERFGPQAGRPRVDTLNGSKFANMKELRFMAEGGVWRVAFAFDPDRQAIVLSAGDKSGGSEARFYRSLIRRADARFVSHLSSLKSNPRSRKP